MKIQSNQRRKKFKRPSCNASFKRILSLQNVPSKLGTKKTLFEEEEKEEKNLKLKCEGQQPRKKIDKEKVETINFFYNSLQQINEETPFLNFQKKKSKKYFFSIFVLFFLPFFTPLNSFFFLICLTKCLIFFTSFDVTPNQTSTVQPFVTNSAIRQTFVALSTRKKGQNDV